MEPAVKKERKANFSDSEVKCLLEGIGLEREVILSKFANSLTVRSKKEAWGRVLRTVNGCGVCARTDEEVKKKWKDLKSAALKEQKDAKGTGGGAPPKETPYKELIFGIIGDCSDLASGIEGKLTINVQIVCWPERLADNRKIKHRAQKHMFLLRCLPTQGRLSPP